MKLTINVTQKHIKPGFQGVCSHCPIALAMKSHPEISPINVIVGIEGTDFATKDGKWHMRVPLPPEAQAFISDFDNGKPVSPFTFTLEV